MQGRKVISLDTECTGVDVVAHGARPYLVTTCDTAGHQRWWQWPVDPLTRDVDADAEDVEAIQAMIDDADEVVLHNAKYDAHALASVGVHLPLDKVWDTLMGSHLLASNHPHNLTDTALEYLGVNIEPFEKRVEEVVRACRQAVKRNEWLRCGLDTRRWVLAEEGADGMPSVNGGSGRDEEKPWKADMWLPDAIADALMALGVEPSDVGMSDDWLAAMREYANADSAVTLPLWLWMEQEIKRRDLWKVFVERMKLVKIAHDLERRGVTISRAETAKLLDEYGAAVDLAQAECMAVADRFDFDLELPQGAAPNDSLREFLWGSVRLECPRCGDERKHKHWVDGRLNGQIVCPRCLNRKGRKTKSRGLVGGPVKIECVVKENPCLSLPVMRSGKTGSPTLNREALEEYATTLEPGPGLDFVQHLLSMRSRQTACTYMRGYERYWVPVGDDDEWRRLHGSANPTATDTIRWGFNNPNTANVSKKEDFNLRRCFGPAPGREWWSMDFRNIELRIPAYESGEPAMIELFERPDDPPYFGSYHLLNASIVYPDEFWPLANVEGEFKKRYRDTLYQWIKNLGFALQYGCGEKKADATAHKKGAFRLLKQKLPLVARLNETWVQRARQHGYVWTLPDKSVDPEHGYPILAARGEDGRVNSTTPFCYHVSGTAMQCTNRAMVLTEGRVRQWNAEGWDGFLTLQVHDELVWDCPRGTGEQPWLTNLWRMDELKALMESVGQGISIPTPVSREYHHRSYATGMAV